MSHTVAAERRNGLAEIALGNLAELLADTLQRFYQHRHQVTVGKEQNQQTDNRGDDNHRAGHTGQAVHHHAGTVERIRGGSVERLGSRTERTAQRWRDVVGLLAVAFQSPLLRLRHLRRHALVEQRLPGADHPGCDRLIHRAG